MDYTKIKEWLKERLTEEKYYHSLETADNAIKISKIVGYKDTEKAYLAGLIHDCAKSMPKDKLREISDKIDFVFDDEKLMPKTLHAPVGKIVAQKELDIDDEEILSAIRFHTIARANMSMLEMIVFLSDKIREEFGTKYFGKDAFDYIKENGIHKTMQKAIENGIEYLAQKEATPAQSTLSALEWFKSQK